MGMIVSPKFSRKLVWLDNLDRLLEFLADRTLPELPDEIKKYNERTNNNHITIGRGEGFLSRVLSMASFQPRLPKMFGDSLDALMGPDGSKGLPRVLTECADYIKTNGMTC